MYRKILIGLLTLVISFSMMGCGKSAETTAAPNEEYVQYSMSLNDKTDENTSFSEEGSASDSQVAGNNTNGQGINNMASVSQKIIYTGQVNIETLEFEKTKTDLCQYISSIGGFIQSSTVNGSGIGYSGLRNAEFIFRIPKDKYNQSFIDLRKFGTVVLEQSRGEDVTEQYFDTEARLKSLRIQQERLEALLKKADKMEDILKIEKELQSTLYDIENYTGTLKKWDSLIEYSTLTVNIYEVEKIKPTTAKDNDGFFNRITISFKNSVTGLGEFLQDLVVFLAAAIPVVIPFGLIGYLIYRVIKKKTIKYGKVKNVKNNEGKGSKENIENNDLEENKDN